MLLHEVLTDLIKLNIQKNRGKRVHKLVRAASRTANPAFKGPRTNPGQPMDDVAVAKPEDMGHFSGSFD